MRPSVTGEAASREKKRNNRRPRYSRLAASSVTLARTLECFVFMFCVCSPPIFEQKRDCSQSTFVAALMTSIVLLNAFSCCLLFPTVAVLCSGFNVSANRRYLQHFLETCAVLNGPGILQSLPFFLVGKLVQHRPNFTFTCNISSAR